MPRSWGLICAIRLAPPGNPLHFLEKFGHQDYDQVIAGISADRVLVKVDCPRTEGIEAKRSCRMVELKIIYPAALTEYGTADSNVLDLQSRSTDQEATLE